MIGCVWSGNINFIFNSTCILYIRQSFLEFIPSSNTFISRLKFKKKHLITFLVWYIDTKILVIFFFAAQVHKNEVKNHNFYCISLLVNTNNVRAQSIRCIPSKNFIWKSRRDMNISSSNALPNVCAWSLDFRGWLVYKELN